MSSFASAQWAYDNAEDPRYYGPDADEDEAKEEWVMDTSLIDITGEELAVHILNEIYDGHTDKAYECLHKAIDTEWSKRWQTIQHERRYGGEP